MLACFYQCTLFFSVSSCPSLFWCVDFRFFSCVLRKREKRGGTDLRRTRADHVRLTKSRECFRSVVSRYHEIVIKHTFFCTQGKTQDCKAIPRRAVRRCISTNYSPSDLFSSMRVAPGAHFSLLENSYKFKKISDLSVVSTPMKISLQAQNRHGHINLRKSHGEQLNNLLKRPIQQEPRTQPEPCEFE